MSSEIFNKDEFRLINKKMSKQIPYGFCHFKEHYGYMTKPMVNEKECLVKGCHYFELNEDNPIYQRKVRIKALKKAKKNHEITYEYNGKTYLVTDDKF